MLACNCLNVMIESELSDSQKVTPEQLNLTKEERDDIFFQQVGTYLFSIFLI